MQANVVNSSKTKRNKTIKLPLIIFLFLWLVGASAQRPFEAAYRNRELGTSPVTRSTDYAGTVLPFDAISRNDPGTRNVQMRAILDYFSSQSSTKTPNSSWINVKDLGAKGDGLTDDTASINSAIAAGAGQVVYFPKGTYMVSKLIGLAANTRIVGDGKGITVMKRMDSTSDSHILYLANSGSSLSGITVDGNRARNPGITGGEIVVQGDDADLHDFQVINSEWISIMIQAKRTRIRNCNLIGSASATEGAVLGIWMANQATADTIIEGCTISDYRWGAIFAGGAEANAAGSMRIINNTFSGNHRQNKVTGGGQLAFGGPGGHVIMGNRFIVGGGTASLLTSGIEANAGATIIGNSFDGGGVHLDGIVLQIGSHYSVSGNQIKGYRESGLMVNESVTHVTITGNDFVGNRIPIADASTTKEKQIWANLPTATENKGRRIIWWRMRQGKYVAPR